MTEYILEFEKPVVELEKRIQEMKEYSESENVEISDEIIRLEQKAEKLRNDIYSKLTRWQRLQMARHPQRNTVRQAQEVGRDYSGRRGETS